MSEDAKQITIEVSNPSELRLIDYRKVKPLQGDLKDLTDRNYDKLKNVLIKRGFKVPLFVWKDVRNVEGNIVTHYWLMDGHQRHRVMMNENILPYEVPYIEIEAKDQKEAKAQLLEISSQYGTITQEGLDEFTAELEPTEFENTVFDALPTFSQENKPNEEEGNKFPQIKPAIIIYFTDKTQMEECLNDVQVLCENKYPDAQITTNEKE